jgi:hypothetical protein
MNSERKRRRINGTSSSNAKKQVENGQAFFVVPGRSQKGKQKCFKGAGSSPVRQIRVTPELTIDIAEKI